MRSIHASLAGALAALTAVAVVAVAAPMPPTEPDDLASAGVEFLAPGAVADPTVAVRRLAGVNAPGAPPDAGWEDSAAISADGTRLHFAYSRIDAIQVIVPPGGGHCVDECITECAASHGGLPAGIAPCETICNDPANPENPGNVCTDFIAGPPRDGQQSAQFDVYTGDLVGGSWQIANAGPTLDTPYSDGAAGAIPGEWLAYVRFVPEPLPTTVWGGDLWLARWNATTGAWGEPVEAARGDHRVDPAVINSWCRDDNPHPVPRAGGGLVLYWDSYRNPSATPTSGVPCNPSPSLWVAELVGSDPADPAAWTMPRPVRITGADAIVGLSQPFVSADGRTLLVSGALGTAALGCDGRACLYRAELSTSAPDAGPDGPFEDLRALARATPYASAHDGSVIGIGEGSMTGDGELVYFTYLEQCGDPSAMPPIPCGRKPLSWDLSIGVACTGPDDDGDGMRRPCDACTDRDGDGYGSPAAAACPHVELDCDDTRASVNPGRPEVPANGLDDDCAPATPPAGGCSPMPQ